RSLRSTTLSTLRSSCPGMTKNLVDVRRTPSYSSSEIETGSLHSSLLHSQRNSERPSTWKVWLSSAIRSLTSRKSDSFRPCLSARVVIGPYLRRSQANTVEKRDLE